MYNMRRNKAAYMCKVCGKRKRIVTCLTAISKGEIYFGKDNNKY